ncbi:hypothetical protein RclHR1_03930006 [Rhizophagus clarus]|uniref:Uncharacterized protein n=1 Tax=Rhizophagus clarus TaxID=94130 RepID=A0A2Z6RDJ9_9GLOM|nr:hypothetical protein RclHR1_03930006 [Rhizophagus clarus]
MSKEDFKECGLKIGPATLLAKEVQTLKEKPKRAFSSYLSLSEVLAGYGLDSDGIDPSRFSLPQLMKFKTTINLEAMRNEYVVALLHAGIHIVMDETNKKLSMRPQYGIVGEGSKGRVNYAIKEKDDLIRITEDKQHKVPVGFAQNSKQLESAYETNRRKRKRDEGDFDYIYSIVTTGQGWHFLLYTPGLYQKVVSCRTP